jgi:hypothetical protein
MPSEEVAMEHQFFIRQQNLKLYRSLVAASEAAAAKADARQEKVLKLLAEEVANEPAVQKELRLLMPSGTLTRVARGDVRDHIVPRKNDYGPA